MKDPLPGRPARKGADAQDGGPIYWCAHTREQHPDLTGQTQSLLMLVLHRYVGGGGANSGRPSRGGPTKRGTKRDVEPTRLSSWRGQRCTMKPSTKNAGVSMRAHDLVQL